MTSVRRFVQDLSALHFDHVFNPYSDACTIHDRPNAPAIRRRNLTAVIEAALAIGVDSIWFGRDLGYRGGRRTGLALTDEAHLHILRLTFRNATVEQATATPPVTERTAQEIWKMVRQLPHPPFLWNVFPFHPHEPGHPMTNRCHTTREARLCEDILSTMLRWFQPERVVALGKDAHQALSRLGWNSIYIRHPSYGGQADFAAGMRELYGLPPEPSSERPL
ncbi:MAG: uracil-DNA glycosylase [Gammaproteobacteria bacterium]